MRKVYQGLLVVILLTMAVYSLGDCPAHADLVTSLPYFDTTQKLPCLYSGFLNLDSDRAIYYNYALADSDPAKKPIILWLQGGPGSSGMFGFFVLNGPIRIIRTSSGTDPFALVRAQRSWLEVANVLYVDQPVGTGFSYTKSADKLVGDEDQMAEDLYAALQIFLTKGLPADADRPWYYVGESYAGKYVPSISAKTLQENDKITQGKSQKLKINLIAAAIGDGLVETIVQRPEIVTPARAMSYVSSADQYNLNTLSAQCEEAIVDGNPVATQLCNKVRDYSTKVAGNIYVYDGRTYAPLSDIEMDDYLNGRGAVPFVDLIKKALHVESSPKEPVFEVASDSVAAAMNKDFVNSSIVYLDYILPRIPVLIYNGNFDLADGPYGAEQWMQHLAAPYGDGITRAPRYIWRPTIDGQTLTGGYIQEFGNLKFLTFTLAGHFIPHDQPAKAIAMLQNVLQGNSFIDDQDPAANVTDKRCEFMSQCNGHGTCIDGLCTCEKGWGRADCSVQIEDYSVKDIALGPREWTYMKVSVDGQKRIVITNSGDVPLVEVTITRDGFGRIDVPVLQKVQLLPGETRTIILDGGDFSDGTAYVAVQNANYRQRVERVTFGYGEVSTGFFSPGRIGYLLTILIFFGSLGILIWSLYGIYKIKKGEAGFNASGKETLASEGNINI
eukprot:TRINITY_DN4110_c0_g2_i1.p1 TRINITY_DN4110_c0_g2~~TRINITY_DN4110_c0_g2_i1.p1  ORF type:complete len:669 (+),score=176.38 TRINITY_DN4110_c0_g2_i1:24-2030(+)